MGWRYSVLGMNLLEATTAPAAWINPGITLLESGVAFNGALPYFERGESVHLPRTFGSWARLGLTTDSLRLQVS